MRKIRTEQSLVRKTVQRKQTSKETPLSEFEGIIATLAKLVIDIIDNSSGGSF